eukprot:322477_1
MGSCSTSQESEDVIDNQYNMMGLLITGYIKTEYEHLPIEIQEIIKCFFDFIWMEKVIHFQKRKAIKNIKFITDSRIKQTTNHLCSIITTNHVISSKISNHWIVKYKIRSKDILCRIGYCTEGAINYIDYNKLGEHHDRNKQKKTSVGIVISSCMDWYCLYDQQHYFKKLKYPNQKEAQLDDEYSIEYNFLQNLMSISHNNANPIQIKMNSDHQVIIPAVALSRKDDEIEINVFEASIAITKICILAPK